MAEDAETGAAAGETPEDGRELTPFLSEAPAPDVRSARVRRSADAWRRSWRTSATLAAVATVLLLSCGLVASAFSWALPRAGKDGAGGREVLGHPAGDRLQVKQEVQQTGLVVDPSWSAEGIAAAQQAAAYAEPGAYQEDPSQQEAAYAEDPYQQDPYQQEMYEEQQRLWKEQQEQVQAQQLQAGQAEPSPFGEIDPNKLAVQQQATGAVVDPSETAAADGVTLEEGSTAEDYAGAAGPELAYPAVEPGAASPAEVQVMETTPQPEWSGVSVYTGPGADAYSAPTQTWTYTLQATFSQTPTATRTTPQTTPSRTSTTTPQPVLFCWAVMMPKGYEVGLIKEQLQRSVSIFGCELHAVLSSKRMLLGSEHGADFYTDNIGDLHCGYGGPYHLALNSEIFARAWKHLFTHTRAPEAKWTVKVDPDAVMVVDRMVKHVADFKADDSVYLNDCDEGLHGPIEVLSRGAMKDFAAGVHKCENKLSYEWTWAGEDVFLRHCLGLLEINRVDDFKLLSEDHCFSEDPAKEGCYSGKAAFHPFKTNEDYFHCLDQAQGKA